MLNRQQKRQLERLNGKHPTINTQQNDEDYVKKRMYTYDEAVKLAITFHRQELKKTLNLADKQGIYTAVCALNSEPFCFGIKRIAKFLELVFEQVGALKNKTLDMETLEQSANNLGVSMTYNAEGHLIIDVDNKPKNAKTPHKTIVI